MTTENYPAVIHCFRSPIGGLFRHVCDLVQGQAAQGMAVGIICDSSTEDNRAKELFEELAPYCSLGIRRIPMSRTLSYSDIAVMREISGFCKAATPQILHGHGAKGGAYARLVAGFVKSLAFSSIGFQICSNTLF